MRVRWATAGLLILFVALALARPADHDESQYVAAAALTARGLIPYRDYAYLQTPLQPFLLAPLAGGWWAWPALRLANAVFGWVAVVATTAAARAAGASRGAALAAGALFAASDILLFSIGTARNDALPAACLAVALWLAVRQERGGTAMRAAAIGLLLAGAAAAKISYAFPAAAYGVFALLDRRRRPVLVALGAAPVAAFVAWTWAQAPAGFAFGTLAFPAHAPADWYAGRPWKLSLAAKAVDTAKFLALGPPALALAVVVRERRGGVAAWLLVAGLIAALLPVPTWRQYLLPALPPLFVLLALAWSERPPSRGWRVAAGAFAAIGLVPSGLALAEGGAMPTALRGARAIRQAAGVARPVATLAPQFALLAGLSPEPRFATGPFVFRTRAIVPPGEERALHVVPQRRMAALFAADPPRAILTGAERWTAGDARLDATLDRWAEGHGYRRVAAGRFTVWVAMTAR